MATRKAADYPAKARLRIKAGVLMDRLQKHALGQLEMSSSQCKAAQYLIDQAIGKATQPITGDPTNPVIVKVVSYAGSATTETAPK